MAVFSRKSNPPAFASAPIKAAAGASYIGNFLNYSVGNDEYKALSVASVSRSRDLIAGMVGALELRHYQKVWNEQTREYDEVYLPLEPWMETPDPKVTRAFFFSNIFSDLFMYGVAYAYVTKRMASGFPYEMTWLPAANISSTEQTGIPQFYGPSSELEFNGAPLDVNNVIQFISPIAGILKTGIQTINTAIYLNAAADRYASLETVPGYLQQVEGEDMSGEDLGDLASAWAAARKSNAVGALSRQIVFKEYEQNPANTVADQRKYQALEISRLCNVPAYLLGAPTQGASMTYQNAQQARQDLYLFGARIYLDCIEQTLSGNKVLPRGRFVEFDIESYLGIEDRNMLDMQDTVPSAGEMN